MLTSQQAAKALGISPRRVLALIQRGDLEAERFGSSWMINEESVTRRAAHKAKPGRPAMGVRDVERLERYTLMNANHKVAAFVYDRETNRVGAVKPLDDARYAPPGACGVSGKIDVYNLNTWIAARHIPHARSGLAQLLRSAGFGNPFDLMFASLGLNLSDQYWFCPEGIDLDWHAVNYFENSYRDGTENRWVSGTHTLWGPSSATDGQLGKRWERRDGVDVLIKSGGFLDPEPDAENLASKLYARLLEPGDYVPYELEYAGGRPYSACPCFITKDTELVTMHDLAVRFGTGYPKSAYEAYVSLLEKLGIANARMQIAKMIVCDFLTANADRHDRNLGVVRNAETLEWERVAPIYDNGRCFYFGARDMHELGERMFFYASNPFSEYPTQQLSCAEDYSWFDPGRLEGFAAEIEETFAVNDKLPAGFAQAASRQFERRLERVVEMAREHGWES